MLYIIICSVALILHLIINYDILIRKSAEMTTLNKEYKSYIYLVAVFFITDIFWGYLDHINAPILLNIDTYLYYITMSSTVVVWCIYSLSYLKHERISTKVFRICIRIFIACCAVVLTVNYFFPFLFTFDSNQTYQGGPLRDITIYIQVAAFALIAFRTFLSYLKTEGIKKRRFGIMVLFGVVMAVTLLIQKRYPLYPIYTMGLTVGICLLHVFIHEDEKEEYRRHIQESEARLKENAEVFARTGNGLWKIKLGTNGSKEMFFDETTDKILGIEGMNMTPSELYVFYHDRLVEDVNNIEKDDYASMVRGEYKTRQLSWEHPTKGIIIIDAGGSLMSKTEEGSIISGYCADITDTVEEQTRLNLVISSLARSYDYLSYANLKKGTFHTLQRPNQDDAMLSNSLANGNTKMLMEYVVNNRIAPEFREEMRAFVDTSTMNERFKSLSVLINQYKNDQGIWKEWSYIVSDRDTDGSVIHVICGIRQIEDEKQAELRKQRIIDDNIAANKAKTTFLHNMSHEIRTPLNALYGFAQLLAMPEGTWSEEERAEYSKTITSSYNMLDMIIGDIIDVADSEHGNYKIKKGEMNVNDTCRTAITAIEYRVPENVKLEFTTDLKDDYTIISDSRRIQQVLTNYLTNACKHTNEGSIHLHCSDTENPGKLTFSVTDTGTGVPADKAELIFTRFTKLDNNIQGSGLGLSICKLIAEKLDGEVFLDQTYSAGARFVFILPA